ncbi:hypothetical protein EDB19DRAFT_487695 [Suillus lakei]|nr:hypothetical protein EDB19DRAFT_487695 [Suillus lakei]
MKDGRPGPAKTTQPIKTQLLTSSRHAAQNTEKLAHKVAESKHCVAGAQTKLAIRDDPYTLVARTRKKNNPVEPAQQGAGLR